MNITVRNCLLLKVSPGIVNLGPEITKENCEFDFHFNKTYVKPTVLNGGHQIILAHWPSYKKT